MSLPWLTEIQQRTNRALDEQRLGHAPLITGPEGVGKHLLADWLVRRLLCLQPGSGQACGHCRSCQLMDSGSHPDFFAVGIPEDKKEIPVDAIRALSEKLVLTPKVGSNRAGMIDVAEAMNINAANALLKTLEEPSDNAWLVLISHQPGRLPATIRSRCQPIAVHPPAREVAQTWLAEECPQHHHDLLAQVLSLTADAPLAARALLEDEGMDHGMDILDSLLAIAGGQPVTSVVNENWWQASEKTWRWLAIWSSVMMRHAHQLDSEQLPNARQLPPNLEHRALAGLWQHALTGRAMASSTVRQDLLMIKWLLKWESITHSGNPN
jgi:DNA polymerase III subunit delta'